MWLKQKLIFSQFWRQKFHHRGSLEFSFWWGLSSWLTDSHIPTVSSHGIEREQVIEHSGVSFYKGTNPTMRVPHLTLITYQRPRLQAITLELRGFDIGIWGSTKSDHNSLFVEWENEWLTNDQNILVSSSVYIFFSNKVFVAGGGGKIIIKRATLCWI